MQESMGRVHELNALMQPRVDGNVSVARHCNGGAWLCALLLRCTSVHLRVFL